MMKPIILSVLMLFLHSLAAAGQQGVRWKYEYQQPGWCASGPPPYEITFYEDGTFEYRTRGWGIGKGTYEMADSIITCTYSGEAPEPAPEEGWVEVRYPVEGNKAREVTVLDSENQEPLIGAEVSLLSADGALLETLATDFDGQYTLPKIPFYKVSVAYVGYHTEEAVLFPGFAGKLIFCLAEGQEELVIARGVRHVFRVWKAIGQEVILEAVEWGGEVFIR
ncbi:MAG: carboxypeptidase regulatory-like domain-containing protein [Phaeodactylibacter sp.]|nr:carboxypeptidase regulatory-like domain-containing protein [Phaeodactylibacter sp.]MCB9293944.1 carboxypeptidase regulatory-like domain-containing protein [Lewinellaceae bacterium]